MTPVMVYCPTCRKSFPWEKGKWDGHNKTMDHIAARMKADEDDNASRTY